jgi:F420-dependent oxidoreductase-like protein
MIELPSPCLVVLVGPPGSGKSTWAREHLGEHVVSSDELRDLVGEGEHDLRASSDAFDLLDTVVERRLGRRLTTVIDSLGTDAARRAHWRQMAQDRKVPCVAVVFDLPASQVRRQNAARPRPVPVEVLRRQLADWPAVRAEVEAEPFAQVHRAEVAVLSAPELARTAPAGSKQAVPDGVVRRGVQFGLQIPRFDFGGGAPTLGADLRAIATASEAAGFDSLWVMDHFRQIPSMGPPWADMLESWTTLAHLAAVTGRVRLGTMVSGITYRNVAHLGKIVATLDVLSGGRVTCGVGLAWYADEHRAYGWDFPDRSARYALLEDALQLLPRLWGPGNKAFVGRVLDVPDTACYPRPLQAHVPLLVGGGGEKKTLALVARYADACNLFGDAATIRHKVAVLAEHCASVGRDPADIAVTHLSTVLVGRDAADLRERVERSRPPRVSTERHVRATNAGTVAQHVDRVGQLVEAGVSEVMVSLAGLTGPAELEPWTDVMSQLKPLL